jgi:Cu(I)/Ag(I) efflux system membrane protein CusA/SilA
MKRIAAPMVGGLLTSAFLTLEIIPVVYTYWRQEQVLWERLEAIAPVRLARLRAWTRVHGAAWCALTAAAVTALYVNLPRAALAPITGAAALAALVSAFGYLRERPVARLLVWPSSAAEAKRAA